MKEVEIAKELLQTLSTLSQRIGGVYAQELSQITDGMEEKQQLEIAVQTKYYLLALELAKQQLNQEEVDESLLEQFQGLKKLL